MTKSDGRIPSIAGSDTHWPASFDPNKHGAVLMGRGMPKRTSRVAWGLVAILAVLVAGMAR